MGRLHSGGPCLPYPPQSVQDRWTPEVEGTTSTDSRLARADKVGLAHFQTALSEVLDGLFTWASVSHLAQQTA